VTPILHLLIAGYHRLAYALAGVLAAVWILRVPCAIASLCILIFVIPDQLASEQVHESLQRAAEGGSGAVWQWVLLAATTAWLSLAIYECSLVALSVNPRLEWGSAKVRNAVAHGPLWILVLVPSGAMASACLQTAAPGGGGERPRIVLFSAASIFGIFMALLGIVVQRRGSVTALGVPIRRLGIRAQLNQLPRHTHAVLWSTAVLWVAAIIFASTSLVQGAVIVGAVSVLLGALAMWTAISTLLVMLGYAVRMPLIALLFGAAVLFSAFDLNDNHKVREASVVLSEDLPTDPTYLEQLGSFREWLATRTDHDAYAGASYPVVLVSTEGGGIRAAYLTAQVLAAIQDRCPGFAEHVFAISSVSGGSLGAAVFAGLVARAPRFRGINPCNPLTKSQPEFEDATDRVLQRDFLSPVLAKMVFPDLVQRFWFMPVVPFDRAVALEQGFERAWAAATHGNEFSTNFYSLWSDTDRAVPPLVLNATVVETGERIVITPHHFRGRPTRLKKHVRLSTAVGLSARFPYVTPAGWVDFLSSGVTKGWRLRNGYEKVRLVDGGYYDNSGAASLLDLVVGIGNDEDVLREQNPLKTYLQESPAYQKWRAQIFPSYHFLFVRISTLDQREAFPEQGLGELLSPLRAVLNARNARTRDSTVALEFSAYKFRDAKSQWVNLPFEFVLCPQQESPAPLGWLLSERARSALRSQVRSEANCLQPWGVVETVSNKKTLENMVAAINPRPRASISGVR
jgi:hypothetical protein